MNTQANFISGVIVGAGLMYILDPDRGRRRRALMRDQLVHGAHEIEEVGDRVSARSQDLRNRARGAIAETRARAHPAEVDDTVLEARVRSEMGRAVSNPGSIEVAARQGQVTLSGPVLEHEAGELVSTVSSVRGVERVENRLQMHAQSGDIPGLQQSRTR